MGVDGMNIPTAAVSHEFLAHICDHSGLDQTGVEGVAEIMKPIVGNSCAAKGGRPSGLQTPERRSLIGEEQSPIVEAGQEIEETDPLAESPASRLRVSSSA